MSSLRSRTFSICSNKFKLLIFVDGNYIPWFRAIEVALFLHYKKPDKAIRKHVCSVNKMTWDPVNQNVLFINESGMYELIYYSKLPGKQLFREWITLDVLPSIRKSLWSSSMFIEQLRMKEECIRRKDKNIQTMLDIIAYKDKIISNMVDIIYRNNV